jgi:hypothetical protein
LEEGGRQTGSAEHRWNGNLVFVQAGGVDGGKLGFGGAASRMLAERMEIRIQIRLALKKRSTMISRQGLL